ncbi:paraslipin [Methylobacterium sp. GXS13]|uniref:SPFH domain-containing protein n=1 Tax=Methylobacterium sp. GXS13 TaxID=1730094 RepID=UPI000A6E8D1F|nr:paraslipin [Methylobacterium sp. GXS13]
MDLTIGLSTSAIAAAALAVITLAAGVKMIPQGHVFTVERFGRYNRALESGLGLIIPFVERIGRRVNVMEQVIDVPSQQAFTRDNAVVTIDAVVFYQVLDAARASYEVANLDLAMTTLTVTNIRTVVGSMDLDQLLAHRDEINERLLRILDAAASPWGVKINRNEIKDIVPPADLAGAMARQMKAEREKRASILEAEGQRAAEILRAEARERSAEAEAAATGMVSRAIAEGDIATAKPARRGTGAGGRALGDGAAGGGGGRRRIGPPRHSDCDHPIRRGRTVPRPGRPRGAVRPFIVRRGERLLAAG